MNVQFEADFFAVAVEVVLLRMNFSVKFAQIGLRALHQFRVQG